MAVIIYRTTGIKDLLLQQGCTNPGGQVTYMVKLCHSSAQY